VRNKIFKLIEKIEEEGLFDDAREIMDKLMKENNISVYGISIDDMFDSPGYDVCSITVAWIENGNWELAIGSVGLS
jgi:hypothetical protein